MKNKVLVIMSAFMLVLLTGCSFSSFTGGKNKETVIPENSLIITEKKSIDLASGKLAIPEGYIIGEAEVTDASSGNQYKLTGIWEEKEEQNDALEEGTEEVNIDDLDMTKLDNTGAEEEPAVEYKEPEDKDILFYYVEGEDTTSPDEVISGMQISSCMNVYVRYLKDLILLNYPMIDDITMNDAKGNPVTSETGAIKDRVSKDGKWFYTTFTCTSGEGKQTTYNTLCYPKTFYGIVLLSTNTKNNCSRDFRMYVFSNDGEGKILKENDYTRFMDQIKSDYSLSGFYTAPVIDENNSAKTNYYNGRSYAQFEDLMQDTYNYFTLKENNQEEEKEEGIKFNLGND